MVFCLADFMCLFWVEINLLSAVCCGGWVVFVDCLLSLSALLQLGWRTMGESCITERCLGVVMCRFGRGRMFFVLM